MNGLNYAQFLEAILRIAYYKKDNSWKKEIEEFARILTTNNKKGVIPLPATLLHDLSELITKKDIKELIEQQFIKRRGDCYIANPLLLYCVDDDYFLDEQRHAAQIKAAKLYYGILL